MLTIVDFLPNTIDFQSSEPLIEQACDIGLETWHEHYWRPMENNGYHFRTLKTNLPWETQNPSYGLISSEENLSDQFLSHLEHLRTLKKYLE